MSEVQNDVNSLANTPAATTAAPPESLTTPAPAPQAQLPNAPWMEKLSTDDRAFLENNHIKEPDQLISKYQNLVKFRGVPEERLVQIPERSDDSEGWAKVRKKLGAPDTPDGYEIPVKDGADTTLTDWAKTAFHKAGLPKTAGQQLAQEFDAFMTSQQEQTTKQSLAQSEKELSDLKSEWGMAYDQNQNLARRAVARLKEAGTLTDDMIKGMEKGMGFANTMKHFHTLGSKIGEHKFISGESEPGKTILSPEAAKQKLSNLNGSEWGRKVLAGDVVAMEEYKELVKQANPQS